MSSLVSLSSCAGQPFFVARVTITGSLSVPPTAAPVRVPTHSFSSPERVAVLSDGTVTSTCTGVVIFALAASCCGYRSVSQAKEKIPRGRRPNVGGAGASGA